MGIADRVLHVGILTVAFAQGATAQQTTQPILEWGPGLAARNELLITRGHSGGVPLDVDGDGDIDILQLYSWDLSGLLTVMENDGRGVFTARTFPPRVTAAWNGSTDIGVGDIDGDGDVDVVVASLWTPTNGVNNRPWVHLGDGRGGFTFDNSRFPSAPAYRTGCVLADVDRDGDLDAIFTDGTFYGLPGRVELWLNDGRGYFTDATASHIPNGTECASNAAAGDLDGDGYPEIVIGTTFDGLTPKSILWNDGTGTFRTQSLPPNNSAYYCYLRDVDLDGDLDVFFHGGQSMLFLNEPTGLRQVLVPNPDPGTVYSPAAFGDVNADGYPDLVFTGTIREPSVLLNDRRGNFRPAVGWIWGDWRLGIETMTFADLDGDGDEDAFATPIVWIPAFRAATFFNLQRQVWGPLTATRGTTYLLDVRGRRRATLAVALSGALLPQPVSLGALGTWHLDPGAMVMLGAITVGDQGDGAFAIPIPNAPHLAGRSFYVQGFDLGTSTPRVEHTTNWWGVRVQ